MQFVRLGWSPLAEGPATIAYRSQGSGPAVVFLHGGWGYQVYPFDVVTETLASRFRVVIPDRAGYGRSSRIRTLPPTFHHLAMLETVALLDALSIEQAVWWGHSDGAVIAALAGIHRPERCRALILEALHLDAAKPGSRLFFERMAFRPASFGERLAGVLAAEHGADRWLRVLQLDGAAWLAIAAGAGGQPDLYDGQLGQVRSPVLLVHGGRDPRSEPGEWEAIRTALPHAAVAWLPAASHSPHSEPGNAALVAAAAEAFLAGLDGPGPFEAGQTAIATATPVRPADDGPNGPAPGRPASPVRASGAAGTGDGVERRR